jgi:hypothetical protein
MLDSLKEIDKSYIYAQSPTIGKIAKSISLLQGEVEDIKKDTQGHGYKYGKLDQALKIVRPLLAKNGLAVLQFPGFINDRISLQTRILHEANEWVAGTLEIPLIVGKRLIPAQECGLIISYARRYCLLAALGMAAEDDDLGSIASSSIDPFRKPSDFQTVVSKPITEDQIIKIKSLLNDDESRIKKMCEYYKVSTISDLSNNIATRVINEMISRAEK